MFKWILNRFWSGGPESGTKGEFETKAATFTIHTNKRYRAILALNTIESWFGNETIAAKFTDFGFKEVKVTGEGATRTAEGRWTGADTTGEIDPHIKKIEEIA